MDLTPLWHMELPEEAGNGVRIEGKSKIGQDNCSLKNLTTFYSLLSICDTLSPLILTSLCKKEGDCLLSVLNL